jgi:outer membrane protein OmpA-like peptidoglycan-associated protein
MNKLTVIILFLVAVCLPLCGQKIVPSPDDLYADAMEFVASGDYEEALFILLNLNDRGYATANLDYKIGECYLNIQGQKTKSIPYLVKAVQKISDQYSGETLAEQNAPPKALFYLGIAYRINYDFDNALVYFNNYRKYAGESNKENIRLAEFHIEHCNFAQELMAAPAKFTIDTLPGKINSSVSNFNPLVTADEKLLYYMNKLKFYDAVMRSVKIDGIWTDSENLTPQIKSDGDHYATGLSSDGTQLFLTFYDPFRSGEIYTSMFRNGVWGEMVKLNDQINTIFNETHASLSPDGEILYFTSDRKGGYGGLDIYKATKDTDGTWHNPVNLGPLINTPYNEETPFVTPDGNKLFFSSQGHYNMGGYDVFYSGKDADNNWLPPVNIGYPLNSTDDDLFFVPLDSGAVAYQSIFDKLSTQKDIVRYAISGFGKPTRFIINGKIDVQADSGFSASSISVAFINKEQKDTIALKPLNEDGTFRQKLAGGNYLLNFGYGYRTLLSRDLSIPDYFPHDNLVIQEKLRIPSEIYFDTIYIRNIRFGFNKSGIDEAYFPMLDNVVKIMKQYPEITLQINGYADALGSADYNLKLSFQRAMRVKEYVSARIDSGKRILVKPFGEKDPVAINLTASGEDSPDGRGYNRRAEMIILNVPQTLIMISINEIPETFLMK